MHKFEIRICPLCSKVLQYRQVAKVNVYACPTQIEWHGTNGGNAMPHYEVEMDDRTAIQHMYVLPYAIDNFRDEPKSRVYKIIPVDDKNHFNRWKFVMQTAHIKADSSKNLLDRIQRLVTFL